MNYTSAAVGVCVLIAAVIWISTGRRQYTGPQRERCWRQGVIMMRMGRRRAWRCRGRRIRFVAWDEGLSFQQPEGINMPFTKPFPASSYVSSSSHECHLRPRSFHILSSLGSQLLGSHHASTVSLDQPSTTTLQTSYH